MRRRSMGYSDEALAANAAKPPREFRIRQTRTGSWYAEQQSNGTWSRIESGGTAETCRANLIDSMTRRRGYRVTITAVLPHPRFAGGAS